MNVLAEFRNRLSTPSGPLPKSLPKLAGIFVFAVVVLPMMFCSRDPQGKAKEHQSILPNSTVVSSSELQSLREDLNRKAEELRRKEQDLKKINDRFGMMPAEGSSEPLPRPYAPTQQPAPEVDKQRQLQDERKSSNIVFSFRSDVQPPKASSAGEVKKTPEKPVLLEQPAKATYRLREGSMLETILTNRLDGTFSGPVDCMVTSSVYSDDRQVLLIPRGSRVLGQVEKVKDQGQERIAVTFHRMILPDGSAFTLKNVPALNAVGETGLRGHVNRHYGQLIGVTAALGIIGGLVGRQTTYGPNSDGDERYLHSVIGSAASSSTQILNRQLNVLPKVTIREGHRVMVYLTQDLNFPAYSGQLVEESNVSIKN